MIRAFTVIVFFLAIGICIVQSAYAADANNRPNAETTGPTGSLQNQSGNKSLGSNQTLENVNLTGCVTITGSNVTIRNSRITCGSGAASINVTAGSQNVLVERVEAARPAANGSSMYIGVGAKNVTVRAVDFSNGGDVIMIQDPDGLVIEDSYLHDPKLAGSGHVDVVQVTGGKNITIRNNTLILGVGAAGSGAYVAAILNKADLAPVNNVRIENNYLSGGQFSVYTMAGNNNACNNPSGGKFAAPTNVKIVNNTFSGSNGVLPLVANPASGLEINCNRLPNGSLIRYRKYDSSKCESTIYTSTCTNPPTTAPTAAPTDEPTIAPTSPASCTKSSGDADCDGTIAITDYAVWRVEFRANCSAQAATSACSDDKDGDGNLMDTDFNSDGRVSLVDFQMWRNAFTAS